MYYKPIFLRLQKRNDINYLQYVILGGHHMNKLIENFDQILEACQEGIYIADENLLGIKINKAYERITGIPRHELIGKTTLQLVNEGLISESVCEKVKFSKKAVSIMQEFRGSKLVLVTGNPVYNHNNELKLIVCTARDITELNRLKIELEETKVISEKYLKELYSLKSENAIEEQIVANSPSMRKLVDTTRRIAQVDSSVLILGESGVGKEVIAKLVHKSSPRQQKPFIKVNCGAIPAPLLESELFGYDAGAFTDARKSGKPGMFELANEGTLFLDEIGELPLTLQVKLLRVLQDYEVTRIGGTKPIQLNVRIITATNQDLEKMVKEKHFREDLYYRINVLPLHIPPLRERKEDILPLVYLTMQRLKHKYQIEKKFSSQAMQEIEQYSWSGNVRELQNIIERLYVMVDSLTIETYHLPFKKNSEPTTKYSLKEYLVNMEKELILKSLQNHSTMRKASEALGIDPSTLTRKCQKFNVQISKTYELS